MVEDRSLRNRCRARASDGDANRRADPADSALFRASRNDASLPNRESQRHGVAQRAPRRVGWTVAIGARTPNEDGPAILLGSGAITNVDERELARVGDYFAGGGFDAPAPTFAFLSPW